MRWLKWGLVVVLVVAAVAVFSTKIFQKKYTYYYYPQWNAYYDVRNKNYIFSIDGGKTWDTIFNSSDNVANTLGEKIVIRSTNPEIWIDNEVHRVRYGGTPNDLVGNFLQREDKKEIKKKNITNDSSQLGKKEDSVVRDSVKEIENWVKESAIENNTAKENSEKEEKSIKEEESKSENIETNTKAEQDTTVTINN